MHSEPVQPPRIPTPTHNRQPVIAELRRYLSLREALERRSILRGLFFLAIVVLLAGIAHAGIPRVFVRGWWRP